MTDFQHDSSAKLFVDPDYVRISLIKFHISGIEDREIAFARLRSKLIPDYGIGLGHRFVDSEGDSYLGAAEKWKDNKIVLPSVPTEKSDDLSDKKDKNAKTDSAADGKKSDDSPTEPPVFDAEELNRQIEDSDSSQLARKVESISKQKTTDMQGFLRQLKREFGEEFKYPGFNLFKYKYSHETQAFALEVAIAFSELLVEETKDLRSLSPKDQSVATIILARKILGLQE